MPAAVWFIQGITPMERVKISADFREKRWERSPIAQKARPKAAKAARG
jgi:hypothetical protein